jgi:hypothetical protein
MDEQLIDLYHRHVGMAFDRQLRLDDFRDRKAPGEKWKHDTATGTLALGKFTFEAPVLGSRQEHNNSWLWAWSDRNLKLSLVNRAMGATVSALAHRLGVHQLSAPGFSLEPLLGTELSEQAPDVFGVLFGAELGYDGYHLIDRGRTTILIRDDRLKFAEKHPLSRILSVFPKAVKSLTVFDHKAALASYAREYGVAVAEAPGSLKLTEEKGELTATFDEHNKLVKLEGNVPTEKELAAEKAERAAKAAAKAAAKPAKKPAKPAKPTKKPVKVAKPAAKVKKAAKKPAAKPAKKAGKKK